MRAFLEIEILSGLVGIDWMSIYVKRSGGGIIPFVWNVYLLLIESLFYSHHQLFSLMVIEIVAKIGHIPLIHPDLS